MKDFIATLRGSFYKFECKLFRRNVQIGSRLRLFKRLAIRGEGKVSIGDNCVISGIRGDSRQYVTLYVHGREATICIGNHVCLCAARFSSKWEVTVGDDVLIEESGIIDTDFHSIDKSRMDVENEDRERCKIVIGNRVSIAVKSMITKGVRIGDDAVIMPGSIVTRSIPSGSIVLGNPAKILRQTGCALQKAGDELYGE